LNKDKFSKQQKKEIVKKIVERLTKTKNKWLNKKWYNFENIIIFKINYQLFLTYFDLIF
jgi:hypothetical protein